MLENVRKGREFNDQPADVSFKTRDVNRGRLVAVEQLNSAESFPELHFDSDLQVFVFVKDTRVFEEKFLTMRINEGWWL